MEHQQLTTPDYGTCTLDNGLRVIHKPLHGQVAYCGFAINAGTRDEEEREHGMAHFVEHLLFKGTRRRKAWHILNRMENVGGDLNAFTNKEETIVYCSFLTKDFARAVDLLADIVFHSTFPGHEVAREAEVILDEIQSYEDTPSELIFDDFEDLMFRGHALGRNILGNPARLREFTGQDAEAFTHRYYRPDNMVLFVAGDIPFDTVHRLAVRHTGDVPRGTGPQTRTRPLPHDAEHRTLHRDTHQAHIIIGTRAYDAYDPRRTTLYLINNLLGGPGMNSRLNVALRERRGLVYNVESNLTSYTDTGLFSVYFGCDKRDRQRCTRLTMDELRRIRDNGLTVRQLEAAKKQLIGQIGVASDSNENNALAMAKAFLHYGKYDSPAEVFNRIRHISVEDVRRVAQDILGEGRLSVLEYV